MANLLSLYSDWKEERILMQAESVYIVPSEFCFLNTCEVPEGTKDFRSVEGIVSLSLESSSPFPLDDILWGFVFDPVNRNVQIFSALKSRIKGMGEGVEGSTYILPDFIIPILDPTIERAVLVYGGVQTFYQKALGGTITVSSEKPEAFVAPILEITEVTPVREFGLQIRYSWKDSANADPLQKVIELPFTNETLCAANMQNSAYKKEVKQEKIISLSSLYISVASVITILVAIGGLFAVNAGRLKERRFASQLASRAENVEKIKKKDERAHELDLFSDKKHAYFRGLEQINELRPSSVIFTSLYASNGESYEIKGTASSLAETQKFQKKLEDSSLFKVVQLRNENVGENDKIAFSLNLTFNKL